MTETQQTMTEFTYATGETDVIGDRFSQSVVLFWLKTSVAASNMRVMYKSPNEHDGRAARPDPAADARPAAQSRRRRQLAGTVRVTKRVTAAAVTRETPGPPCRKP